ncbi:MAG: dephospho-CoA kinase [Cyclobacteriaceae bacterium]|jgi:dephospho-CoA kinase|nr:dephospho-CoA kinase [Flammeovirgaceae bacterium]
MNRPLQVGVTGGIGSGKSLVCKVFSKLGVPVYDADSRAKAIMTTDGILVSQIKAEFGDLAYNTDGSLNRSYLSERIFQHPHLREKLNGLVHPRVAIDTEQWVNQQTGHEYVIREAALMFESGSYKKLDASILVAAPEALRMKRVRQRDPQRTDEAISKIMEAQIPEEEMRKRANFIIENDETQLILPQIMKLHHHFTTHQ